MSNYQIKVKLVWSLGMIWLLPNLVTQSSAQSCFNKMNKCFNDHLNQTSTNPIFNPKNPLFNETEFFCCSIIHEVVLTDKPCFCLIFSVPTFQNQPNNSLLKVYTKCKVADSFASLESLCNVTSTASDSPPHQTKGKKKVIAIIAAVSGAILLMLVIVSISFYRIRSRKKPPISNSKIENALPEENRHPPPGLTAGENEDMNTPESMQYEFEALKVATNNFSDDHKIGQGGFGFVYKGTLSNGQVVAVKRLSRGSWQGDEEFKNEANLVTKLQHKNLVKLVGFCLAEQERLLVYEFMDNKSLDHILFDVTKQNELNWSKRYNIIRGIARGMLYLHEDSPSHIIHRDLKAANVLLDTEMNPKIADFGMAKICQLTVGDRTSRVIGTYGYMAPEYLLHGQYSIKSDVYSFGALVLEIVSGKRVTSSIYQIESGGENLLTYAWRCLREGRPLEFMDSTLIAYSKNEIIRCIHLGLLCVQEDMRNRPTMGNVMLMLNSDCNLDSLVLPERPRILNTRSEEQSTSSNT